MKNTSKNISEDTNTTLDRAELNARLLNTPLAHETKLSLIKEALETNTYHINSNQIAEGLLEYAEEPSNPCSAIKSRIKFPVLFSKAV